MPGKLFRDRKEFDRIQRLARRIVENDETLIEVYKITFFDLLFGDFYSDEINRRIKPKQEEEFILPVAEKISYFLPVALGQEKTEKKSY